MSKIFFVKKVCCGLLITALTYSVSACSSVSDGSLAYQKSQIIAPLDLGKEKVAIKPVLPLPAYSVNPESEFTNDSDTRFVMPRPNQQPVK